MNAATPVSTRALPLNGQQILVVGLVGAALWLLAALLMRWLGPLGIFEGMARLITYVLIIPGTLPFVFLLQRVAGLGRDQIALGVAIATAAATLLDGVALAWFPQLYGATPELVAGSGGTILWGAGVGLVLGCVVNRVQS